MLDAWKGYDFYDFYPFPMHGGIQKGSDVDLSVGVPDNSQLNLVEISRKCTHKK